MNKFITLIFLVITVNTITADIARSWNYCGCRWASWSAWSQCSRSCGGGTQTRDRGVWHHDVTECKGFEKCASRDEGSQTEECNMFCYNGGTFSSYYYYSGVCSCLKGTIGSCCEQTVQCGRPSSISNGEYTGSVFTYNHIVQYRCHVDYNMTDPAQATRTCSDKGFWTGSSPVCIYANSCKSQPCKNGAECVNLLGDYRCTCLSGWSGKSCEVDVQPPVVKDCPTDRQIFTANLTSLQSWTEPSFVNPHNQTLHITKNYMNTSHEFPWGEFTVQYEAVNPSNGLKAECVFKISVKPFPCKPLDLPLNGILACNGWRREFTRVCKLLCKTNYTLSSGFNEDDIYVCGATGQWLPGNKVQKCVSDVIFPQTSNEEKNITFSSCVTEDDKSRIANNYIDALRRSSFSALCLNYASDCKVKNVEILC